jgi:hypothetical protein
VIGAALVVVAMVFGQSKSQDAEQNGEIDVNESIVAALPDSDTEPIKAPESLPSANLVELELDS